MTEVTLPSGAILKVQVAPFADSKALYQAVLKELKSVNIQASHTEGAENLMKDLACAGFSSKEVEMALWKCFERCTYNSGGKGDFRIDKDTFEPISAREDYIAVCMSVAKENILPFVKSLYAEFSTLLATNASVQT